MALSKEDRIAISKKLVKIPRENKTAEEIKVILEEGRIDSQKRDTANKNLQDSKTILINPYQRELTTYDGNVRTELAEQDVQNGADKVFQNFFYPNDPQTPLPNISDGVWKNFPPFSGSKAIGRNYLEQYPSIVVKEQDKINAVNAAIALVEAITDPTRSSGKICSIDNSGTCAGEIPVGSGIDEITCTTNGGVWTPSTGPDIYLPSVAAQDALSALQAALNDWKAFVSTTRGLNIGENAVDTDAGRVAQNNTSIADIDNLISIIDTWDAFQNFDTTTSLPVGSAGTGCALFDAMIPSDFDPSKIRITEIQPIKDEITARQSYISVRVSEVWTNLGGVGQDFGSGAINSPTGFYGDRFKIIDIRLNLMAGSLNSLKAAIRGQQAQDELIQSNQNAEDIYTTVLSVSAFRAPGSGGPNIHVLDGSDFNPGDVVYAITNTQEEITTSVVSKDGNRITLAANIPKKYRENDGGRLYKEV